MDVAEAVRRRISTRAFKPDPVPGHVVRAILETAAQAPSGGNLQPWRVYALAGAPLAEFKALVASNPRGEAPEYDVYPPNLWEPFRTRRAKRAPPTLPLRYSIPVQPISIRTRFQIGSNAKRSRWALLRSATRFAARCARWSKIVTRPSTCCGSL